MKRFVPLFLLVIFGGCSGDQSNNEVVRYTIGAGTPLGVVANQLEELNVIGSATRFKAYARMTGRQRAIQMGVYDLPLNSSSGTILRMLTSGAVATNRLVIPEGLMAREISALVAHIGIAPADFMTAIEDSALRADLEIPGPNLEGYLYPSTYDVPVGASADDLVRQMTREFQNQWREEWTTRAADLGFTRYEVVTFASIVEGEVMYRPDGPVVSSLYHNRLNRGMRLQADPTVIFAMGVRRTLFERDYQYQSPYNTYLIDGLPPGPIGQPSAASIDATLNPRETDFLFMVADTTGKHIFSRTLREHNTHVAELREIWARQRRSSARR